MKRQIGRLRDEKGISTVIVVVSLLALFGAVMLSLDAGNLWQTRRNIVTATDATALDQARRHIKSGDGCGGATVDYPSGWQDYLYRNAGSGLTTPISCTVTPGSVTGTGYVVVEGRKTAQTRFGGLFGIGDTSAYSLSAAQVFWPQTLQGLRPIGICAGNHHYKDEWVPYQNYLLNRMSPPPSPLYSPETFPDGTPATQQNYDALATDPEHQPIQAQYPNATGPVHHITYDPNQAEDLGCGNDPGNWGWQDFNTSPPQESELIEWVMNGYNGEVGIDDCNADDTTGDGCEGGPGGGGGNNPNCRTPVSSLGEALKCMVDKTFPVIVYDTATCTTPNGNQTAGGDNCVYDIIGFLGVILRGFEVSTGQSNRYFDFEFVDLQRTGRCCAQNPNVGGVRSVRLCEVDHDVQPLTTIQDRCGD